MSATTTPSSTGAGQTLALVAMCLGVFLIANDFTALTVAIPDIESDLDTTLNRAQWVINAYTVTFGVLIVTGGRLADVFGRKRAMMVGAVIFAAFSLLGGFAPTIELLIAARCMMAIGGALLWPAVLGLTYSILPDDKAGFAGGLIIGVAGLGNAFGPLLGGVLTDAISWRWVFFVNVPITVVAMIVTDRYVDESRVAAERRIDYLGIAALSVGAILVLVALDVGTDSGFGNPGIIALFVLGGLFLAVFVPIERREGETALTPADVIGNRHFAAAIGAVILLSMVFFSAIVYVPQFLEKTLGWSAIEAGAGLLPMMVLFAGTSFVAGPLYDRLGARMVLTIGAAALTVGIFLMSFLSTSVGYPSLVPGLVVTGVGVGLFYSAVTTAAVTSVDESRASLAGAIVYMCQIGGGSIGLGVATALVLSQADFVDGIALAFRVAAAVAILSVVLLAVFIGPDDDRPHGRLHLHLKRHHRVHGGG